MWSGSQRECGREQGKSGSFQRDEQILEYCRIWISIPRGKSNPSSASLSFSKSDGTSCEASLHGSSALKTWILFIKLGAHAINRVVTSHIAPFHAHAQKPTHTHTHRVGILLGPLVSLYENLQKAKHKDKKVHGTDSISRMSRFSHAKEWALSYLWQLVCLQLPKEKKQSLLLYLSLLLTQALA